VDDLVSDEVARPNKALQPTQNRRVVIHLMNIQVRPAATTDGPSIEALHSEWGYKSGFSQNDQIFLAQKGEQIVGVVKLTFESNVCVLRGMFIKTELQGKGIGSKLLGSVNEWLGNKQAFWLTNGSEINKPFVCLSNTFQIFTVRSVLLKSVIQKHPTFSWNVSKNIWLKGIM